MKKKILVAGLLVTILTTFAGCGNKAIIDTKYTFNKAIIDVGNEVIAIEVENWKDYEDGEQLQIVAKDGTVYLTSSFNCTLIEEK